MSLSAVDSYRSFTAEPKLRSDHSRHAAERRDESDGKPFPGARDGRPQRLERALTSALESLKLNVPVASPGFQAPAGSTDTSTDSVASTDPVTTTPPTSEDSIKQAVHEFAHALAQALRGGEHAERGGRGRYAEMSQGLERLSQAAGSGVTAASGSKPAAAGIVAGEQPGPIKPGVDTSTIKTPPSPSDTREPEYMPIKVDNPTIENPILVTQPLDATATTEATVPATAATTAITTSAPAKEDRLLSAFKHLFNALQPATASASGATVDYSAKLRDFLHTLGQALSPHGDGAMPTRGGLLNVTA